MNEETTTFKGSSSQVLNIGPFCLSAVVAGAFLVLGIKYPKFLLSLVVPVGFAVARYVLVKSRVYEITTERIRVTTGILTRKTEELELYRVKDVTVIEPLILRLFKLGNITITTNDTTSPSVEIVAIPGVKEVREILRKNVETCRDKKRVRVAELE